MRATSPCSRCKRSSRPSGSRRNSPISPVSFIACRQCLAQPGRGPLDALRLARSELVPHARQYDDLDRLVHSRDALQHRERPERSRSPCTISVGHGRLPARPRRRAAAASVARSDGRAAPAPSGALQRRQSRAHAPAERAADQRHLRCAQPARSRVARPPQLVELRAIVAARLAPA